MISIKNYANKLFWIGWMGKNGQLFRIYTGTKSTSHCIISSTIIKR